MDRDFTGFDSGSAGYAGAAGTGGAGGTGGASGAAGEGMESPERKGGDGMISELARKAVSSSVSRLIETEGFIRELVRVMSRELGGLVSREVSGLRQDIVQQAGNQFGAWLDRVNVSEEVRKGLNGMTFDITLRVHVSDDGVKVKTVPAAVPPVVENRRSAGRSRAPRGKSGGTPA